MKNSPHSGEPELPLPNDRTSTLLLTNNTPYYLNLVSKGYTPKHGKFVDGKEPPDSIAPYSTGSWQVTNTFFGSAEGEISYAIAVKHTKDGPTRLITVCNYYWDNSQFSSSSYKLSSVNENFLGDSSNDDGHDVSITLTFELVKEFPEDTKPRYKTNRYFGPSTISFIDLLDVWGEGRLRSGDMITGYPSCYNLNKHGQKRSNGDNKTRFVPNLIQIFNYDVPGFPIPDKVVNNMTLYSAPMIEETAREMGRVFSGIPSGVIVLFDVSDSQKQIFEENVNLNRPTGSGNIQEVTNYDIGFPLDLMGYNIKLKKMIKKYYVYKAVK